MKKLIWKSYLYKGMEVKLTNKNVIAYIDGFADKLSYKTNKDSCISDLDKLFVKNKTCGLTEDESAFFSLLVESATRHEWIPNDDANGLLFKYEN